MPSKKHQRRRGDSPRQSTPSRHPSSESAERAQADERPFAFHIAIIVVATLGIYSVSFQNGYIWDDADYVYANRLVQGNATILDIWLTHETPQYYPVTFSSFWLEHKIWGLHPTGFHVVNCCVHLGNAVLLYRLMRRVCIELAFATAFVFAIHPIQVETVAWITERKNVLAVFFFLLAVHFHLKYDAEKRFTDYLGSFLMFVLSLLSKSVTVSFVFVPILIKWWKKQELNRWDLIRIIPFCVVGLAAGLHTAWIEVYQVGASGLEWELSGLEKVILPGRIILFYLYKIFVPFHFIFSYPRWELDPASVAQWIPTVIVGVFMLLFIRYREPWGRGAAATFGYFILSLFPALGIFNVYPMRYSFVADHFTYLSTIPGILFMVGTYQFIFTKIAEPRIKLSESFKKSIAPLTLAVGGLIMIAVAIDHARDFKDAATLWLHVIEKNPRSVLAYNSLGLIEKDEGQIDRAVMWFDKGLEVDPHDVEIRNNLGIILAERNQLDRALEHFEVARKARPDYPETYNNIATAYAMRGQFDQAVPLLEKAIQLNPRFAPALYNLGRIYRDRTQRHEAIRYFQQAIESNPAFLESHLDLAATYTELEQYDLAIQASLRALSLGPSDPRPHTQLGIATLRQGHLDAATVHFENALRCDPNHANARSYLNQIRK